MPDCKGTGQIKTIESMSIGNAVDALAAHREGIHRMEVKVHAEAPLSAQSPPQRIAAPEDRGEMQVVFFGIGGISPEQMESSVSTAPATGEVRRQRIAGRRSGREREYAAGGGKPL